MNHPIDNSIIELLYISTGNLGAVWPKRNLWKLARGGKQIKESGSVLA